MGVSAVQVEEGEYSPELTDMMCVNYDGY